MSVIEAYMAAVFTIGFLCCYVVIMRLASRWIDAGAPMPKRKRRPAQASEVAHE